MRDRSHTRTKAPDVLGAFVNKRSLLAPPCIMSRSPRGGLARLSRTTTSTAADPQTAAHDGCALHLRLFGQSAVGLRLLAPSRESLRSSGGFRFKLGRLQGTSNFSFCPTSLRLL